MTVRVEFISFYETRAVEYVEKKILLTALH
jgi:hypothetical protein